MGPRIGAASRAAQRDLHASALNLDTPRDGRLLRIIQDPAVRLGSPDLLDALLCVLVELLRSQNRAYDGLRSVLFEHVGAAIQAAGVGLASQVGLVIAFHQVLGILGAAEHHGCHRGM